MILEAAVAVIDEVGWSRASTNRIAERAGVSIGSLYQYFADKEAILASLVEQHQRDVHRVVAAALDRLEDPRVAIDEGLRSVFEGLVALHRATPVLTRVLSTGVPHQHGPKDHAAETAGFVRRLEALLRQRDDVQVRDPALAAQVLATTSEALTRWLVHEVPPDLDVEALVDEIVTMLSGYLVGASPRSRSRSARP
jgi:AcrR family transcriptional regulator